MGEPTGARLEERVLILAPAGSDAALASSSLKSGALVWHSCSSIDELCRCIREGAGAVLISSEALEGSAGRALEKALAPAPAWSDLPLIVITSAPAEVNS